MIFAVGRTKAHLWATVKDIELSKINGTAYFYKRTMDLSKAAWLAKRAHATPKRKEKHQ